MKRIAYLLRIRPGKEHEYLKAHEEVWPELVTLLQSVGFYNYTIFKRGLNLFVYVEAEDFEKALQNLIETPLYQAWADKMEPIMEPHPDRQPGETVAVLSEVFHID